jgi:hypothetical protein
MSDEYWKLRCEERDCEIAKLKAENVILREWYCRCTCQRSALVAEALQETNRDEP